MAAARRTPSASPRTEPGARCRARAGRRGPTVLRAPAFVLEPRAASTGTGRLALTRVPVGASRYVGHVDHDWSTEGPDDGIAECARCGLFRARPVLPGAPYLYARSAAAGYWSPELPPCRAREAA